MNKELIIQLILLFLITQSIGLVTGNFLIEQSIHATIVTDNPEDVENSFGLILGILIFTAGLLALLKYAPEWIIGLFLKGMETMAIFGTSLLVLMPLLLKDEIILGIAILFVALRIFLRKNNLIKNLASVVASAGAGALIGASLGVTPIILFIILLAIYDYIAVFKTKHMITLAKGVTKKNLSFTYTLPTKQHNFELGTGDMVIPLTFAVSVLGTQTATGIEKFVIPSLILIASLIGLILTLHYCSLKKDRVLPALPLQTALMIIVFGITKLIGF